MALGARRHGTVDRRRVADRAGRAAARRQALGRPRPGDPPELTTHPLRLLAARGRRRRRPAWSRNARLRGPADSVEEDDAGITFTSDWVEDAGVNGLFVAHALGRFAAADLGDRVALA